MCDPITLAIVGVNAAATVGAGAIVNNQINKSQAKAGKNSPATQAALDSLPSTAPTKTEADIQTTVEGQRSAMNLSQLGFGANFSGDGGGDSGALGAPGDYIRRALSAYRLGA